MAAEYQVIARKWRPQRFADVVGQQHVVRTLENAIRQNRLAHAYLFVGPRGVGKTTLARIFAKAMNCEHPQEGEPCCQCRSCRAVAEENSLDVIEIDAASYNSVDDMRRLNEEVLHRPVAGRFKIYIIDEVHMLSKAAWNALLKTIEEPPAHVKFIFATTEVHMVLATIISRCQRFDLQPIPTRLIAERLRLIADSEHIPVSAEAIDAIARAAEGGMRDAQSLLDQMIAFFSGDTRQEITGAQVLSLFGLTDADDLDALLRSMLTDDRAGVVTKISALARKGKNLETLFTDILEMLRSVQMAQLLSDPASVLDQSPEELARSRELARLAPRDTLQLMLEVLSPVGRILHDALDKQILLECLIQKAMREAHAIRIGDLLKRLNQLRTAGELQFLEQLPVAAKTVEELPEPAPSPVAVVAEKKTPETPPDEPAKEPVPIAVAPVMEPKPLAEKPAPAPVVVEPEVQEEPTAVEWVEEAVPAPATAPERSSVPKFDVSMLFIRLLERVRAEAPEYAEALERCTPALHDFTLDLTASGETCAALHALLPKLHAFLQDLTGDWRSMVALIQNTSAPDGATSAETTSSGNASQGEEEELDREAHEVAPPVVEVPEIAPDAEPAKVCIDDAVADAPPQVFANDGDFELVHDESDESIVELDNAMPLSMTVDEALQDSRPSASEGTIGNDTASVPPKAGSRRRESKFNNPQERAAASNNAVVQQILDLFGGKIVDVHH